MVAPKIKELTPLQSLEERRDTKRILFYRGEFPDAKIVFAGKDYVGEVYDISSQGTAILPKDEIPGLDTLSQQVQISFGNSRMQDASLQNISFIKYSGSLRLRMGFQTRPLPILAMKDSQKIACQNCMPMVYCEDPIAFNRTLMFNVTHFTPSGFHLMTDSRDGVLFAGMRLDARLLMPARGEFRVVVEVFDVQQDGLVTRVVCNWCNPHEDLLNSVSEYLLMSSDQISIKELRKAGFFVAEMEKAYIFRSAQSQEEFERILQLRLHAAQADGRWKGETDHRKMSDSWDKHARQIYGEVNGRVVASARIVFNNGLRERSEHVGYGVEIPEWLWEEGFVEGSRVCTDPDFRGSDLLINLIQRMSIIVTQTGYRYLLMNCEDSLIPIYRKTVGVFSLEKKFHTEFMQDKPLNLLCVDFKSMQLGLNQSPSTWVINAPVGDHLLERGRLKASWWQLGFRRVFAVFHQVAFHYFKRMQRKKIRLKMPRDKK